jgi:hypothetical protein
LGVSHLHERVHPSRETIESIRELRGIAAAHQAPAVDAGLGAGAAHHVLVLPVGRGCHRSIACAHTRVALPP